MAHPGGCLCGAIRYAVDGPLAPIQLCHCAQCRKAQGSAFGANIPVEAAAFRLLQGQEALRGYQASPGKTRWFCSRCGSPVYSRLDASPGTLRLRAGTLDGPVPARPESHAFVASKADWWAISDALPRHPQGRPG